MSTRVEGPIRRRSRWRTLGIVIALILATGIISHYANEAARPGREGSYFELNSEQVLKAAAVFEKRLADSNRPKPLAEVLKHPLIRKDEVTQAREALERVARTDHANAEQAKKILAQIAADEEDGKRVSTATAVQARANDSAGRIAYAKEYEHNALMSGYSATVTTSGPRATTLKMTMPLTKAGVYQLVNDSALHVVLREKGFIKFVVSDGYKWTGTFDLK